MKINSEFKNLIPPISKEERNLLEKSLIEEGCRDPLVVWNGVLVDGHNRYEICHGRNIAFKTYEIDFKTEDDARLWIVCNQMGRRNLTPYQRVELALIAEPILAQKAKENQINGAKGLSNSTKAIHAREEIAKLANVSEETVHRVKAIKSKSSQETKDQLRQGLVSINQVFSELKRDETRKEKVEKINEISKGNAELKTDKKYPVILCDPPWEYDYSVSKMREIDNHYPTMALKDITELPVEQIACESSVIFLWVTSPKLIEGIEILHQWGFEYRTCMVWIKDKIGMGYYARQRHELLLIGSKGEMPCPLPENRPDSVMEAPRGKHSEKPDLIYEHLEKMYPEFEKIELFSRNKREGWQSWGNQV